MARKILLALLALIVALVAYLLLWPVPIDPQAWTPPAPLKLEGSWAPNDRLAKGEVLAPTLQGPEAIAIDGKGRLYSGTMDGRIVMVQDGEVTTLAKTGGRPLGIKIGADGVVYVADAEEGLLHIGADGGVKALADALLDKPFGFTDDLAILGDGTVVFTDASSRWSLKEFENDVLEHRPWGRLLVFSPEKGTAELLADGLYFPNGVAALPDGSAVLVCETSTYRVLRVELRGEQRGRRQVVLDGLPGFCDNITYSPSRDAFWLALGYPRDATLDKLGPRPFWRKVVYRLPRFLQPRPRHHAMAVLLRADGTVVEVLQDPAPDGWGPLTSVLEHDGSLYLGSFRAQGIKRVPLR